MMFITLVFLIGILVFVVWLLWLLLIAMKKSRIVRGIVAALIVWTVIPIWQGRQHQANVDALCQAAERADLAHVCRLLAEGVDPNEMGMAEYSDGNAILASGSGRPLDFAVTTHQQDKDKQKARAAVVTALIKAGAEIGDFLNYSDQGDACMVKTLLANGASPDYTREPNGDTPLIIAVQQEKPEKVAVLLAAGADVNKRSRWNGTPLFVVRKDLTDESASVRSAAKAIEKMLLARGAKAIPGDEGAAKDTELPGRSE